MPRNNCGFSLDFFWSSYSSIPISISTKKLFKNLLVLSLYPFYGIKRDIVYTKFRKQLLGKWLFSEKILLQMFWEARYSSYALTPESSLCYVIFLWYNLKVFPKNRFSFHPDIFKGKLNEQYLKFGYCISVFKAYQSILGQCFHDVETS